MALRNQFVWVWAAAGAGVAAWAAYSFLPVRSDSTPAGTGSPPASLRADAPGPVAVHAMPGAAAAAATGDRFKLVGVMINGNDRRALITVDGRPARMFRVGESVDGDVVVRNVSERGATLGPREGGASATIEMALAPPSASDPATTQSAQAGGLPSGTMADSAAQSPNDLGKVMSKHPPLQPPAESVTQKPVEAPVAPVDDGRWRPSGQQ